jgi:hypothetical protein
LQARLLPFPLHAPLPLLAAILQPRGLDMYLISLEQGLSLWFIIHLVVALVVWGGGGSQISRRRRHDVVV